MITKEKYFIEFLKKKGGMAGYRKIIKAGFNKAFLKNNLDSGRIQKVNRALYRLSGSLILSNPDLAAVSIVHQNFKRGGMFAFCSCFS